MRISGEQIASGTKKWIEEEIKSGPSREYDLGKFLFSVSSGTIGFLLVAAKLDQPTAKWNLTLTVSFVLLLFSILTSMYMVQPKKWNFVEDEDLFKKRNEIIGRTIVEARLWAFFWTLGLISGVFGVFTQ